MDCIRLFQGGVSLSWLLSPGVFFLWWVFFDVIAGLAWHRVLAQVVNKHAKLMSFLKVCVCVCVCVPVCTQKLK